MNLSERLAKAAHDRRRQYEAEQRAHLAPIVSVRPEALIEFDAPAAAPFDLTLPGLVADPVDAAHVEPMKMRLPDASNEPAPAGGPLPLWERPLLDLLNDAPLATVTSLPIVPRDDLNDDDHADADAELAQPIPMRGEWMPAAVDVDLDELHVPPLAAAESEGLAGVSLRAENLHAQDDHTPVIDLTDDDDYDAVIDLDDVESLDGLLVIDLDEIAVDAEIVEAETMIDLDEIAVDAEIVEADSADALLDRWSAGVSAYAQDQQTKVDGLYQRMVDAAQRPRITFGPMDIRDDLPPSVAAEHLCPQCGAVARIDIHDPMRGRIHLSCDSCFKMWQEKVGATVHIDEPFMRD